MKKRLLVLLTVLLVLAACTPGAFAYDVAAEQAADFGTASLESALPEQAYDAFGELSGDGSDGMVVWRLYDELATGTYQAIQVSGFHDGRI